MPAGWGYSYLDWMGAYSFALAMLSALFHRERTGEGQWIDASQTEVGLFINGTAILDWSANGRIWTRYGNRSPYKPAAPHGVYPCAGRRSLARHRVLHGSGVARADQGRGTSGVGEGPPVRRSRRRGWRTRMRSMP